MIRFDGYYILPPSLFDNEGRASSINWYNHSAYLFLENGFFLKASKYSKLHDYVDFDKSDFTEENKLGKFNVNGKQVLLYFYEGQPWEFTESLEIITVNDLKMKNGVLIKFVPFPPALLDM